MNAAIATSTSSRPRAKNRVGVINLVDEKRVGARVAAARQPHWAFRDDGRESAVDSRSYLQPEPLLQPRTSVSDMDWMALPARLRQEILRQSSGPGYVSSLAKQGKSAPTYAYAFNNPLSFIDPDGNAGTKEQFCSETGSCPLPDFCAQNPQLCNGPPGPGPGPGGGGGGGLSCEDPKTQGIITCPGKCAVYGGLAYLSCKAAGGEKCALFAYKVYMGCMEGCPPELPN